MSTSLLDSQRLRQYQYSLREHASAYRIAACCPGLSDRAKAHLTAEADRLSREADAYSDRLVHLMIREAATLADV